MKITVACVQMQPELFEVERNLKKMGSFIETIMKEHPDTRLIIFPELITTGYECGDLFYDLSETVLEGKSLRYIADYSAHHHVSVVFGFPERDENSNFLYNTSVFIADDGKIAGVYRKVHLFDTEKKYFHRGSAFPLIETSFGKVGLMICWDTAFPEVARTYALKGADLLVVSTNWEKPYMDDWDLVTRARAFDNCLPLAAANRTGRDRRLSFFGHSKIIDPLGHPLRSLNREEEGFITAVLDLDQSKKLRKDYYTFFDDRIPELYKELTKVGTIKDNRL
jgi:predicted amidohydrolase